MPRRLTIEDVIEKAGLWWPRSRKIECPKHSDSSPSLHLYDDEWGGHFHCFACGEHGDAYDLLTLLTGEDVKRPGSGRTEGSAGVSAHKVRRSPQSRARTLRESFFTLLIEETKGWPFARDLISYWSDEWQTAAHDLADLAPVDAEPLLQSLEYRVNVQVEQLQPLKELAANLTDVVPVHGIQPTGLAHSVSKPRRRSRSRLRERGSAR